MLRWCCCCYPYEYEEIKDDVPRFEREVDAVLLWISNLGYISVRLIHKNSCSYTNVQLFDFSTELLCPNQISILNNRYANQPIVIKWMDAASFLSSSILLTKNTPRLCQIITLDGTTLTDCIKAYLLE